MQLKEILYSTSCFVSMDPVSLHTFIDVVCLLQLMVLRTLQSRDLSNKDNFYIFCTNIFENRERREGRLYCLNILSF